MASLDCAANPEAANGLLAVLRAALPSKELIALLVEGRTETNAPLVNVVLCCWGRQHTRHLSSSILSYLSSIEDGRVSQGHDTGFGKASAGLAVRLLTTCLLQMARRPFGTRLSRCLTRG